MAKNKVLNSKKLENLLAKWPDLSDYPIRVKEADKTARLMLGNLIKVVKQDEQIAKELEELNRFKLKL